MTRFPLLISVLASCACGSLSPHENFKAHMSRAVGKIISDSGTWAREDRLVSVQTLENGNEQYEYMFRRSCFYFFEVKKSTQMIVGWRFEGSEEDCQIFP